MSFVFPTDKKALELKAISIKIEKLEQWMFLYRAGKINSNKAIEILCLLHGAYQEQKLLITI